MSPLPTTPREIGLVGIVALGFVAGLLLVGRATAPLLPDAVAGPQSRVAVVSAAHEAEASARSPSDPPADHGRTSPTSRDGAARDAPISRVDPAREAPTTGDGPGPAVGTGASPDAVARAMAELRDRHFTVPVAGVERDELHDSFDDPRSGGRTHRAIDIMAPRGTPVFAVEDGTIAELDDEQPGGGVVVYQYDPHGVFAYYYAHLEKWADGLEEGDRVGRGQVIGYVGSTGNARPDAPHLHFAITLLGPEKRWWGGTPLNPFGLF